MERVFLRVLLLAKNMYKIFDLCCWNCSANRQSNWCRLRPGLKVFCRFKDKQIDVVIVDEQLDDMSGIAFVKQLVKINPLVNTAIVGTLADHDFHEATEGLGVLMQLPADPGEKEARTLLGILEKIGVLLQPAAPQRQKAGTS